MVICIENLSLQLYTCASPQSECPPIAFCQFSVVSPDNNRRAICPENSNHAKMNPASVRQGHNNRTRILHLQPLQLRRILLMGIYHMSTCIFGFEKSQKSIATDLAAVLPYVFWMFTHCDVPRCLETNLPRCIPHQVYPILRTDITYASINYTSYRDNNCHRDTTSQIWLYNSIITLYQRKV